MAPSPFVNAWSRTQCASSELDVSSCDALESRVPIVDGDCPNGAATTQVFCCRRRGREHGSCCGRARYCALGSESADRQARVGIVDAPVAAFGKRGGSDRSWHGLLW